MSWRMKTKNWPIMVVVALCMGAVLVGGCGKAKVMPDQAASEGLSKPDHIQVYQGVGASARLVAEGDTTTTSSLKPGMGVLLPVGAAAGTIATTAVVAGSTTAASEAFFAAVEADAKRTAQVHHLGCNAPSAGPPVL